MGFFSQMHTEPGHRLKNKENERGADTALSNNVIVSPHWRVRGIFAGYVASKEISFNKDCCVVLGGVTSMVQNSLREKPLWNVAR